MENIFFNHHHKHKCTVADGTDGKLVEYWKRLEPRRKISSAVSHPINKPGETPEKV